MVARGAPCYNQGMDDIEEHLPTMTAAEFDGQLLAAVERRAVETEKVRMETEVLRTLLQRKQRLVARLEATLVELQAEQAVINDEVRRLLTPEEQSYFAGHSAS